LKINLFTRTKLGVDTHKDIGCTSYYKWTQVQPSHRVSSHEVEVKPYYPYQNQNHNDENVQYAQNAYNDQSAQN